MCTELFKNSVATGVYTRSSQSEVPNYTHTHDDDSIPNEDTPDNTPSPMSHSVHDTTGGSGSSSRKRHSSSADEDTESLKRGFNSLQSYLDRKMSSADMCMEVVQKIEGISTSSMSDSDDEIESGLVQQNDDDGSEDEMLGYFLFNVAAPLISNQPKIRIPQNTSCLSGEDWLLELLNGADTQFYNALRLTKPCFRALVDEFKTRGLLFNSQ
ncbi:hypothetical protein ACS0TY_029619 [Phlomoides rotata]